jgi:hypothetical protein
VESVSQPPKSERTSKVIDPQKTFWGDGYKAGKKAEREQIIKQLQDYFDLTLEPNEDGSICENPEWDNGFQVAIALIKGAKDD